MHLYAGLPNRAQDSIWILARRVWKDLVDPILHALRHVELVVLDDLLSCLRLLPDMKQEQEVRTTHPPGAMLPNNA